MKPENKIKTGFNLSKALKDNEIEDGTSDPILSSNAVCEIIKEFIRLEYNLLEDFRRENITFEQFLIMRNKLIGEKLTLRN